MKLTAEQVENLVYCNKVDNFIKIKEEEGENRRWSRTNRIIIQDEKTNKYYSIYWEEGLTEEQENEFEEQEATEVKKIEKTIIVTDFEEI